MEQDQLVADRRGHRKNRLAIVALDVNFICVAKAGMSVIGALRSLKIASPARSGCVRLEVVEPSCIVGRLHRAQTSASGSTDRTSEHDSLRCKLATFDHRETAAGSAGGTDNKFGFESV